MTRFLANRKPRGGALSEQRELYSGLIRLHVLYHACQEPIFGLRMIEELARHGYRLSAGTLYPLLNGMEKSSWMANFAACTARRPLAALPFALQRSGSRSSSANCWRRSSETAA